MSANGDHEMADAVPGSEIEAIEEFTEPQRIRVVCPRLFTEHSSSSLLVSSLVSSGGRVLMGKQLPGSTDTAASFEFTREDHTLGNALRYIIMKKYGSTLVHSLL